MLICWPHQRKTSICTGVMRKERKIVLRMWLLNMEQEMILLILDFSTLLVTIGGVCHKHVASYTCQAAGIHVLITTSCTYKLIQAHIWLRQSVVSNSRAQLTMLKNSIIRQYDFSNASRTCINYNHLEQESINRAHRWRCPVHPPPPSPPYMQCGTLVNDTEICLGLHLYMWAGMQFTFICM